ncbi:hypothetical protein [Nostoc sp.]|uniref:hypothetical protein n=1 Tax=Nostoc sp. TaxID=1180 RepID=UPI002FF95E9D
MNEVLSFVDKLLSFVDEPLSLVNESLILVNKPLSFVVFFTNRKGRRGRKERGEIYL